MFNKSKPCLIALFTLYPFCIQAQEHNAPPCSPDHQHYLNDLFEPMALEAFPLDSMHAEHLDTLFCPTRSDVGLIRADYENYYLLINAKTKQPALYSLLFWDHADSIQCIENTGDDALMVIYAYHSTGRSSARYGDGFSQTIDELHIVDLNLLTLYDPMETGVFHDYWGTYFTNPAGDRIDYVEVMDGMDPQESEIPSELTEHDILENTYLDCRTQLSYDRLIFDCFERTSVTTTHQTKSSPTEIHSTDSCAQTHTLVRQANGDYESIASQKK